MIRFDWYSASVQAFPERLAADMTREFGGEFTDDKPRHSFAHARRHADTRVRLMWGGRNPLPFVEASGVEAEDIASWLRRAFPGSHRVARADVCLDYDQEGAWDLLCDRLLPIARDASVQCIFFGDPDATTRGGRTWYFGSKSSDVRLVLYEKGLKELSEGNECSPHWVRVELRVRPRKERKSLCSTMDHSSFFGLSRWTQRVLKDLEGELIPFTPDLSIRKSSDERALDHMAWQYGRVMQRVIEDRGPQALLQEIRRRLSSRT